MKELLICIFFISFYCSFSQNLPLKTIRGKVADKTTNEAIEGTYIIIKHRVQGTFTDKDGQFSIEVRSSDTLLFRQLGYAPLEWAVVQSDFENAIYLSQENKLLPGVTVTAPREEVTVDVPLTIKWRTNEDYIKEYNIDRNRIDIDPHYNKLSPLGPNAIIVINSGRYEKKKLKMLESENIRSSLFMKIIRDEEVKDQLVKEFSLTGDQYFVALEGFNREMQELQYSNDKYEIMQALYSYFSKHKP